MFKNIEVFMSKYCPRWVYMTIVAQACFDYIKLDLGAGLLVISHKYDCLLYTSPSPRDPHLSRMPSSA